MATERAETINAIDAVALPGENKLNEKKITASQNTTAMSKGQVMVFCACTCINRRHSPTFKIEVTACAFKFF
jgi:hypothetical protein